MLCRCRKSSTHAKKKYSLALLSLLKCPIKFIIRKNLKATRTKAISIIRAAVTKHKILYDKAASRSVKKKKIAFLAGVNPCSVANNSFDTIVDQI